jgi:hypothetical protein
MAENATKEVETGERPQSQPGPRPQPGASLLRADNLEPIGGLSEEAVAAAEAEAEAEAEASGAHRCSPRKPFIRSTHTPQMNLLMVQAGAGATMPRTLVTVRTGSSVPEAELAPYLVPQRAGDPLGIGILPGERPPAPADPDPYDRARENKEYARSLLSEDDLREADEDIEANGYLPIETVRRIVDENTAKGSVEAGGLDPEILWLVDARIDYKIFIAGDNLYTREELYDHFPFHEFNVQPEAIFVQQEIGVFPPRKHALMNELEYLVRDAGDESIDFVMLEDLVGAATRANYKRKRAPLRVVKTKIYVGKERWEDFALLQRFARGAARVAMAQIAYGGASSPILSFLTGNAAGTAGGRGGPLLLADLATLEAERRAREAEAARREEELRRREEELRRREEEARRAAAATQRKLDADLRRIEEMLEAATLMRAEGQKRAAERAKQAAARAAAASGGPETAPEGAGEGAAFPSGSPADGDEDDSVAI